MDADDLFDDGFDDLTDHVLQELERNAIQLTQAWALGSQQKPSPQDALRNRSSYGWDDDDDDDLDTTEVTNHVGVPVGRPVLGSALQQRQPGSQMPRRSVPPVPNPRWNPTVDPANRPGARARQPGARPPNQPPEARGNPPQSQFARPPLAHGHRFPESQASQTYPDDDVSELQQRLRALEAELNAARGEVSIVRANSTKAQHKHDAEMARLKRHNAEQLAERGRIAEAAVAAERSANTELQFLQRDMREVSDRARRKDPAAGPRPALATPRKTSKTWGVADGFDDMDMAVSPSRGQGRGRASGSVAANVGERTPTKGKRKRPVAESPMAALDTHTEDVVMDEAEPPAEPTQPPPAVAPPTASLEFLQLVLDHGSFHHQPPTFDTLSRFAFPSDPTATSLASIIFERLPLMGDAHRPMQLLVDFAQHVISLWGRCVAEQFWEPVKYLVALVAFTLDLDAVSVAPLVVADLAPVAQATVVVLAESRRLPSSDEHGFLDEHIDTTRILSLLYTSALACATTPSETDDGFAYSALGFWRHMTLNTVLLLLTPRQKLDDMLVMLDLLASSSLPASIGPVSAEAEPAVTARAVIERVSAKLTEQPLPATTPEQRRRVRLAALRTLIAFARSPFGALQLASHSNALPRLVTCLSASIDDLYDQPLPPSALPPPPDALASSSVRLPEPAAPAALCRVISQSLLLIHALVTDPATANAADVGHKLSLAHGGSQRYLLALGRLTFAEEDLVIESAIDGDVVEAAHELLELAVTPDEGETVSEAFGA